MHRTTAAAATALAAAAAASITVLATPAAADTTAPSPTTRPTWIVVHPTYGQPDATPPAPSPSPSPTTRGPIAPNWYPPLDPTASVPVPVPVPTAARRTRATITPPARTVTHRPGHRRPSHRPGHRHHAPTMQVGHTTYRAGSGKWLVVHGETLSYIARIFDVTVDQLARANGITNPDLIIGGQWLTIPAGGAR